MKINPIDIDFYRKDMEVDEEGRPSLFYALVPGDNVIRILPPWAPHGRFSFSVFRHFSLPPEGKNLYCMETWNKLCPVCEVLKKYRPLLEEARTYSSRVRVYVNALIPALGIEPKIVGLPWSVYTWIRNEIVKVGDITNPLTGANILIQKTGKGFGTRYECVRLKDSPLASSNEEIVFILSKLHNLDEIFKENPDTIKLLFKASEELVKAFEVLLQKQKTKLPEEATVDNKVQTSESKSSQVLNNVAPQSQASVPPAPAPVSPHLPSVVQSSISAQATVNQLHSEVASQSNTQTQVEQNQKQVLVKPKDAPDCWGRYKNVFTECVLCVHESTCIAATNTTGK